MTALLPAIRKSAGRVLLLAAVMCLEIWTAAQVHAVVHLPRAAGAPVAVDACCVLPEDRPTLAADGVKTCPQGCALCVASQISLASASGTGVAEPPRMTDGACPRPVSAPRAGDGVALPPANGPPASF